MELELGGMRTLFALGSILFGIFELHEQYLRRTQRDREDDFWCRRAGQEATTGIRVGDATGIQGNVSLAANGRWKVCRRLGAQGPRSEEEATRNRENQEESHAFYYIDLQQFLGYFLNFQGRNDGIPEMELIPDENENLEILRFKSFFHFYLSFFKSNI